jgi:hypothetical protein
VAIILIIKYDHTDRGRINNNGTVYIKTRYTIKTNIQVKSNNESVMDRASNYKQK